MRYLTVDQVIRINARESETDGAVRDPGLLESAVALPRQSAGGQDAYPDVFRKAAALMRSIAQNQPFLNGNKRTAVVAAYVFLASNGWLLEAEDVEVIHLAIDIAIESFDVPTIAEHLRKWCTPIPDPEEEE